MKRIFGKYGPDPLISVIVPAFNEEMSIRDVLDKLVALQKFVSIEIVVVDDGCVDKTAMIAESFPSVKLICHSKNMGKGRAIATGLSNCKGDIIVIQDRAEGGKEDDGGKHLKGKDVSKRLGVIDQAAKKK